MYLMHVYLTINNFEHLNQTNSKKYKYSSLNNND